VYVYAYVYAYTYTRAAVQARDPAIINDSGPTKIPKEDFVFFWVLCWFLLLACCARALEKPTKNPKEDSVGYIRGDDSGQ